jgi:murein DD-endopeptidase MepM/ murein hydrolase activator NlpD
LLAIVAIAFLGGAMAVAFVNRGLPRAALPPGAPRASAVDVVLEAKGKAVAALRESDASRPALPAMTTPPSNEAEPSADLRSRRLEVPVQGMTRDALRDSYDQRRGIAQQHEAIDIMAPRDTPIRAVEDGVIARLFESKAGGTTVYQFDPSTTYVYYYAHLARYADGLHEGQPVQRAQVLGYVGTSGNAPKDTPHLHFAIFRLTDAKHWWQGSPINPYDILK